MRKTTGPYPSVHVDAAGAGVVSQAGGVLLVEALRASGLDWAMSAALGRWRKPFATHDPAKIACDLAVTLALGGDAHPCWELPGPPRAAARPSPPCSGWSRPTRPSAGSWRPRRRRPGGVEGDQHRPSNCPRRGLGARRRSRSGEGGQRADASGRGCRRDARDLALRQGTGRANVQQDLRLPSAVRVRRPRR